MACRGTALHTFYLLSHCTVIPGNTTSMRSENKTTPLQQVTSAYTKLVEAYFKVLSRLTKPSLSAVSVRRALTMGTEVVPETLVYWTQNNWASLTVRSRHVGGRGRPQNDSTQGERTQSFSCIIRYGTVRFRLQKYRNRGQLWVVNVFSYTIHAQTDCWPFAISIFFLLLLWRFLSSQLFCVHCSFWRTVTADSPSNRRESILSRYSPV
jgi:hypothetical protein